MSRKRRKHYNDCAGKVRYGSFDEAKQEQPSQSPYLCWRCGCWHLTSMFM